MIGSGIFIVDADIAREPTPRRSSWAHGGYGYSHHDRRLSYGELAAMMPKAGGQYVYLRESLGPLWGFSTAGRCS